jgi:hypothetical protein
MRIVNACKSTNVSNDSYRKKIYVEYISEYEKEVQFTLEVKRKNLNQDYDKFWDKYLLYSLIYNDKGIKELIDIMKENRFQTETLIKMYNKKYSKNITSI